MRGLWLDQPRPRTELEPPTLFQAQPASYTPTVSCTAFPVADGVQLPYMCAPIMLLPMWYPEVNVQQTTPRLAVEVEGTTEHISADDELYMGPHVISSTPAQEHSPHSDRASPIMQATHTARADYSMASWTPSPTPDMGPLARYDPHVRHAIIRHLRPRNLPSRQSTGLPLPSG